MEADLKETLNSNYVKKYRSVTAQKLAGLEKNEGAD